MSNPTLSEFCFCMIGSTSKDQKATSLCTLGSHKPVIPVVNSSHIPSARRAEVSELKATSTPVYDLGVIAFPLPVLLHVARPGMAIPPSRVSATRTSPILWENQFASFYAQRARMATHQPTYVVPFYIRSVGCLRSVHPRLSIGK